MIVALGLLWRVCYVLVFTRHEDTKFYDAAWYELQAVTLAAGHFFPVIMGHAPDAAHPPMTSFVITPATWLFGLPHGETPERLTMAVAGALVVLAVGLLGRALGGYRVGLVAAAVAALYPNMWIPSGIVMSETLTMLLVALVLLGAYRLWRSPTLVNAALLGLACGLEMLTRAELVLLVPCLLVPAALVLRPLSWRRRLAIAAVAVAVAALTVGPWVGRNLASFQDATFLSTGEGPVLLGANCPSTYGGPYLGSWSLACSIDVPNAADQSVESARQASAGLHYARAHADRLPEVVAARVGRVWDFYEPLQMVDGDVNEGRPVNASFAGLLVYWCLLPFAAVGVVVLRRRAVRVWPLLVIAGIVTFVAATGYGLVRFRAEFEVPLVVLAAAGMEAGWRRLRHGPERNGGRVSRWRPPAHPVRTTRHRSVTADAETGPDGPPGAGTGLQERPPVPATPGGPAHRRRSGGAGSTGTGRRALGHLVAIALFTLPAVVLWWGAWHRGAASTVRCACLDPGQQVWFIAWPAHALAHGLNPFFSHWLWPPAGVNLLANASAPLAGLAVAPFTWLFGPLASTTLALTLVPGLSAWGCWVACRRFTSWRPACVVAGLLFGYSPFLVESVAQGHLSTGLLVFPALMLAVLHEVLVAQRWAPRRAGAALGALALGQFLVSPEILTVCVLVLLLGLVAAIACSPRRARAAFPHAVAAFGWAALVGGALLALPAWFMVAGPQHITGSIWSGLQAIFVAATYELWNPGPYRTTLFARAAQGPAPQYLGFAVLGAAVASVALSWRRAAVWVLALVALAATVLSWGSFLQLGVGDSRLANWLPWAWFTYRPVLDNISAAHFAAPADLAVCVVVAIGLDSLRRAGRRWALPALAWSVMAVGAAAALLVPLWVTYDAPLAVQPLALPPWYATTATHVPVGSVVLTYPFPSSSAVTSDPMVWQAADSMRFRLAGGYVKVPGPRQGVIGLGPAGSATRTLDELTLPGGAASGHFTLTAPDVVGLRAALRRWSVRYVVVTDLGPDPVAAAGVFSATTGSPPDVSRRAWVWDLTTTPPPGSSPAAAAAAFARCGVPGTPGTVPAGRPLPQALNRCAAAGG